LIQVVFASCLLTLRDKAPAKALQQALSANGSHMPLPLVEKDLHVFAIALVSV
jgi:hypothetical protein